MPGVGCLTEGGEHSEDANEPGGQVKPETVAAFIKFAPARHLVALTLEQGWTVLTSPQPQPQPWLMLFVPGGSEE